MREESGQGWKVLQEIVAANLPNLARYLQNGINLKKSLPRNILIKLLKTKNKGKILKAILKENNTLFTEKQWERQAILIIQTKDAEGLV